MTETTPPPVDITKDRLVVFMGGSTVPLQNAEFLPDLGGYIWLTRFPDEETPVKAWPRPVHTPIMINIMVGTVDELCEQLRTKLTTCFNTLTMAGKAVIPAFGEASMRKQTEMIEANDLVKNPIRLKAGRRAFNDWYNRRRGACAPDAPEQKVAPYEADVLRRTVAMYHGLVHGDGQMHIPNSLPSRIDTLVSALLLLKADYMADYPQENPEKPCSTQPSSEPSAS